MATKLVNVETIGSYFESLSDPRHTRNRKHLLVDIVVIAVCGILCGSDGPTAIHRWADNRRDWLKQFLSLPNGIPSRDCIRRLLMALKPEAFQARFQDWISHAIRTDDSSPDRLVAIDGNHPVWTAVVSPDRVAHPALKTPLEGLGLERS